MAYIAAETPTAGATRKTQRRGSLSLVRFFAIDGAMRVVIEADNEDDARYLCHEMRWDFICLCDR